MMSKKLSIEGKVWVIKDKQESWVDDIDTDMIFHNEHLAITEIEKMGTHAFGNLPEWKDFPEKVNKGDILIVGDDENIASSITSMLTEMGYGARTLSFKDNIHDYIPGELKAIYLVMNDVNEQGFGSAIKIHSACSLPIIAVGPEWTKTKVIKAVKYGVSDILMTPASPDDIKQNINNNLVEMAA